MPIALASLKDVGTPTDAFLVASSNGTHVWKREIQLYYPRFLWFCQENCAAGMRNLLSKTCLWYNEFAKFSTIVNREEGGSGGIDAHVSDPYYQTIYRFVLSDLCVHSSPYNTGCLLADAFLYKSCAVGDSFYYRNANHQCDPWHSHYIRADPYPPPIDLG
jgi:hypothetical protein